MTRVQSPVAEVVHLQNLVCDQQVCASFVRDAALVTESAQISQASDRARYEQCLEVGYHSRNAHPKLSGSNVKPPDEPSFYMIYISCDFHICL